MSTGKTAWKARVTRLEGKVGLARTAARSGFERKGALSGKFVIAALVARESKIQTL